jgi:serine/threonine protein kinase
MDLPMSDAIAPSLKASSPSDSRTPVPASGNVAPPAFGRYRLIRRLGSGCYGEVWLADDLFLNEAVALKFLNEIFTGDAASLDDLKREVRTLRRLSHPNIVRVHDLVYDRKHTAIVMEYIDGHTLAELVANSPHGALQEVDIDVWLPQFGSVFDYLHRSEHIIHSDIKPLNLMVTTTGRLKVADFGLAVTLAETSMHSTQAGSRAGTIAFMSPQQLRGSRPAIADDIYSLGATLFHLLTGTTPFHGNTLELLDDEKRPPTIAARRYETGKNRLRPVPELWESAIAACLAKDAAKRPGSVRDVVKWMKGVRDAKDSAGLGTSVILPPHPSVQKKPQGWVPLPAKSSESQKSKGSSPASAPVSSASHSSLWLWAGLLIAALAVLGALLFIGLRYL